MISEELNKYVHDFSTYLSPPLAEIEKETFETQKDAHMLCGPLLGSLLRFLVQLSNAKKIVDVGTFVGFSALTLAEALSDDGEVISLEKDPARMEIARQNIKKHHQGHKVKLILGDALENLEKIDTEIDLSFLDANKKPYLQYYELLVQKTKPGGIIVIDDALWKGKLLEKSDPKHLIMDELNQAIAKDPRVENVLIPLRHGINLVYKLKT